MRQRWQKIDQGKKYLVAATLVGIVALLVSFKGYGYEKTWQLWGVETLMPPFADFRLLPGTAETVQSGIDPRVSNPGDPYGRVYNYPRLWNLFFYTTFTQEDVIFLGVLMLIFYYLSVIAFPEKINMPALGLMLLLIFSPAAMLLYERGNVDLILFVLTTLVLLSYEMSTFFAGGILLIGAMLKVFPLFGLVIFLQKGWEKFWRTTLWVVLGFLLYFITSFSSMKAAWQTTMRGKRLSYGTEVFFAHYHKLFSAYLNNRDFINDPNFILGSLPKLLVILLLLLTLLVSMRDNLPLKTSSPKNLIAFQMGAFIYIGTFLLGNNWDYRLVFLLFTMPQLGEWLTITHGKERRAVITAIILILLSTWHFLIAAGLTHLFSTSEVGFIIDEIANWLLFGVLLYLGYASFPAWFKDFFREMKILQKVMK